MSLPDVDVVIPTKDRPELLVRAVRSVLTQDYATRARSAFPPVGGLVAGVGFEPT